MKSDLNLFLLGVFVGVFVPWLGRVWITQPENVWLDFKDKCEQVDGGKAVRRRATGQHICMPVAEAIKQDYPEAP